MASQVVNDNNSGKSNDSTKKTTTVYNSMPTVDTSALRNTQTSSNTNTQTVSMGGKTVSVPTNTINVSKANTQLKSAGIVKETPSVITTQTTYAQTAQQRANEKAAKDYSYTNDDFNNSVYYYNSSGDRMKASDFDAEIKNWQADVERKAKDVELVNQKYLSGSYGNDEYSYSRYLNDFDRTYKDYEDTVSKQEYYRSFDQADFIDYQTDYEDVQKQQQQLHTDFRQGKLTQQEYSEQNAQLQARRDELKANIDTQNKVKGGLTLEKAKETADQETINRVVQQLNAYNYGVPERLAQAVAGNVGGKVAGIMGVVDAGVDLLGEAGGRVLSDVAQKMAADGKIDNDTYNSLVDVSQDMINYTVAENGVSQNIREWSNNYSQLAAYGTDVQTAVAVNLVSNALVMGAEMMTIPSLIAPLSAVSSGANRYAELTANGVDPAVALGNSLVMGTLNYYATKIPMDYSSTIYQTLGQSKLTWEAMQFLTRRALQAGTVSAAAGAGAYAGDWINNSITEFLSGQDTGLEYSAGDLFKNALRDMGSTCLMTVGTGTLRMGYNSVTGQGTSLSYDDYVREYDRLNTAKLRQKYVRDKYKIKNADDFRKYDRDTQEQILREMGDIRSMSRDNPYYETFMEQNAQNFAEPDDSFVPETYLITTEQEYNQAKAERDVAVEIYDQTSSEAEKIVLERSIAAVDSGLQDYEAQHPYHGMVVLEDDMASVPSLIEAQQGMTDYLVPNAIQLLSNDNAVRNEVNEVMNQTVEKLTENRIIAKEDEFVSLPSDERAKILKLGEVSTAVSDGKIQIIVDTTLSPGLPGNVSAENGVKTISINPDSELSVDYLIDHEVYHTVSESSFGDSIRNYLDSISTPEQKEAAQEQARLYPESQREEEYYADLMGNVISDTDYLLRLQEEDPAVYQEVKDNAIGLAGSYSGITTQYDALLNNIIDAFSEVSSIEIQNAQPSYAKLGDYSLSAAFVDKLGDKLTEDDYGIIDSAEEMIWRTGDLSEALRSKLADKLYERTWYEMGDANDNYGITVKDVNRFLKQNPFRWEDVKPDLGRTITLMEFMKQYPGVKISSRAEPWDKTWMYITDDLPNFSKEDVPASAVDFIQRIMDYRDSIAEANEMQMGKPLTEDEWDEELNRIIDDYIDSTKIARGKQKSQKIAQKDAQKQLFAESIDEWIDDYDILRAKYDSFDDDVFRRAMADMFIEEQILPETRQALMDSIIQNDFNGAYTGGKAGEYVNRFVNDATDYYLYELNYRMDPKYLNKVARTANIINQARAGMYDKDFERSAEAVALDEIAKKERKNDINAVYDLVDELVQSNVQNKKNILQNQDMKEYFDLVAGGDKNTRRLLTELYEDPIYAAEAYELQMKTQEMADIRAVQEETGIKMYSKEDNAVGWLIEGHKQDKTPYSLEDLKNDYPDRWEDIKKLAEFISGKTEGYYNEEEGALEKIYGDVEYQNQVRTAKLQNQLESAKRILAQREADMREDPSAAKQAGYSKAKRDLKTIETQLKAQLEENLKHTNSRREHTPYRKNYFHHTDEIDLVKNTKAFFQRGNKIPTALAGRTDQLHPRSTVQNYRYQQGETNYSSSGLASIQHRAMMHANAMAFDPTVSYLRTVQSVMGQLDMDKNLNNIATWTTKYTDMLAGKTNELDRLVRDMTHDEVRSVIEILNSRARKNAVFGNVASALVQAGNFPLGAALVVENGGRDAFMDFVNGSAMYFMDVKNGGGPKSQSTFLGHRYFNSKLKDARWLKASLDDVGEGMMTILDKLTAEELWYTFYAQGRRLNIDDPIRYADDMVDRSVQGRRPSQMPLSQQSKIVQLVAPFQVEVNNQWQAMKGMGRNAFKGDRKGNAIAGLLFLTFLSSAMNAAYNKIVGREPLFDPLGAIMDVLEDEDTTMSNMPVKMATRMAGELLSAMPYGQYVPSLLGMDEDTSKEVFGESDPSRYGIGNIGMSALVRLAAAAATGDWDRATKEAENVIFTYGFPGYGKQAERFYRAGQEQGLAPKYVNGEWRMDPIHYTSSGGVAYVNDPSDVGQFFSNAIRGSSYSDQAKEYYQNGYKKLGVEPLKDFEGNTIKGSQAALIRKEMENLGVYDTVVDQINKGEMTCKQAGLTENVINMSDEDFEAYYNSMLASAGETIVQNITEAYGWDDEQVKQFTDALSLEADYGEDGKKVTDSEALKTRKAMEDAGIYDEVIEYLNETGADYSSVGLGKRVVGYDQDKFLQVYAQKIKGE